MRIDLRTAHPHDVAFAHAVFLASMGELLTQLFGWNEARQAAHFAEFFRLEETRIIVADGRDVGWVQEQSTPDAINVGSFYIAPASQRLGIGGVIIERIGARAVSESKAVTLAVVKINPAMQFYVEHGFRITHEDEHKFYMKRDTPTGR